jgi:hypothetical protein
LANVKREAENGDKRAIMDLEDHNSARSDQQSPQTPFLSGSQSSQRLQSESRTTKMITEIRVGHQPVHSGKRLKHQDNTETPGKVETQPKENVSNYFLLW